MSFVWVQDVSVGASADAADVKEMQSYYNDQHISYMSDDLVGVNTTYCPSYLGAYYPGYLSGYLGPYYTGHLTTDYPGYMGKN